jgi:hypothetical protein
VLRCRIAFALRRATEIVVGGLRQGLNEGERYAVADHVVRQLKERGDPSRLYASSNLNKAREIFTEAIKRWPQTRPTIRQRTRVLEQWP